MDLNKLAESLSSMQQKVPDEVAILELRRMHVEDIHRRLKKLLRNADDVCGFPLERGHWVRHDDRTLVQLPGNAYAVVYHASGALKLWSGVAPMDKLYKEMPNLDSETARAREVIKGMGLADQLPRGQSISFERLWQLKAAGADRSGKMSEPVLCRTVTAFRHMIDDVPVLGAASLAVKLTGDGSVDTLSMQIRNTGAEVLDRAKIVHPERAIRQIVQQVKDKFSHLKEGADVHVEADKGLQFGYMSLPKRKIQRLLAPAYVASISVSHELERQAFLIVVPATERAYMEFNPPGHESPVMDASKLAQRCCCQP